ncbi:hypothetical protein VHEMI05285 [[Torrubiella] hemipterigena]|uniref:Peptidase A4 family protein n=1 Tax=[Torrubiella] hemipterigena TaxID=1531966 RepID=A0A0A1TIB0_9HYPO|nr:hypothetical protein VHEMI05285 [[Torrubiella] hemipterigena]
MKLLSTLLLTVANAAVISHKSSVGRPAMIYDALANYTTTPLEHNIQDRAANYDTNWAGSVQEGSNWSFITGTSRIPYVADQNGASATLVGIDGLRCTNAVLQTGYTIWGAGAVELWYEWWPNPSYHYSSVSAKAGDYIRMSVWAYNSTSGRVMIENLTTGQSDYRTFQGMNNNQLCRSDAAWIVGTPTYNGQQMQLANFGTIDITNTQAQGDHGTMGAAGGNIVNIYQNGYQRTSCGAKNDGMECRYVQ